MNMPKPRRIDVHHHLVPARYAEHLRQKGIMPGGVNVPEWTAAKSLRLMRRAGIDTSILSLSTPGAWFGDAKEARWWAREMNEYTAGVVHERPHQFGFFATLTLPDVEGAILEAGHALDELNADGIVLLSNAGGVYLADPSFEPLLDYLHQRRAVVFVHPGELPAAPVPGIPSFTADFLLDTVRAATGLVLSGALEKYDGIKFVLAHAGGFLPYISHRVLLTMLKQAPKSELIGVALRERHEVDQRLDLFRRFYYDVALSSTRAALPSLLAVADPTRILYGSDYPFNPTLGVRYMRREYETYPLEQRQRERIDRTNALDLFPRLRTPTD